MIPAFKAPFYRHAYWRWIRWPKDFNVRLSDYAWTYGLDWIDESLKKETAEARSSGKTYPPAIEVYDKWKPKTGIPIQAAP